MRTIIAGSRDLTAEDLSAALAACPWLNEVTEVICGCAPGIDREGCRWARSKGLPISFYPAWESQREWALGIALKGEPVFACPAVVGKRAGYIRNVDMSRNAEALIATWDGVSPGTDRMLEIAERAGLKIHKFVKEVPPSLW